jgi:hypothetical protein
MIPGVCRSVGPSGSWLDASGHDQSAGLHQASAPMLRTRRGIEGQFATFRLHENPHGANALMPFELANVTRPSPWFERDGGAAGHRVARLLHQHGDSLVCSNIGRTPISQLGIGEKAALFVTPIRGSQVVLTLAITVIEHNIGLRASEPERCNSSSRRRVGCASCDPDRCSQQRHRGTSQAARENLGLEQGTTMRGHQGNLARKTMVVALYRNSQSARKLTRLSDFFWPKAYSASLPASNHRHLGIRRVEQRQRRRLARHDRRLTVG